MAQKDIQVKKKFVFNTHARMMTLAKNKYMEVDCIKAMNKQQQQ